MIKKSISKTSQLHKPAHAKSTITIVWPLKEVQQNRPPSTPLTSCYASPSSICPYISLQLFSYSDHTVLVDINFTSGKCSFSWLT